MIRRSVHGPGSRETVLELRSCSRRYRRCGGGGVGAIANRWSHLVMPSDYLVSVSVQLLLKAESDTCLTEAVARWAAAFGCGLNR